MITVRRRGFARILLILRRGGANAAALNADSVQLQFGTRRAEIALSDMDAIELQRGALFSGVRIIHGAGDARVSGLRRADACELAEGLESARRNWWRRTLAQRSDALQSVHERLSLLENPHAYVRADALRDLEAAAGEAVRGLTARWPDTLSDIPEAGMLRGVLDFLAAPVDARTAANDRFVADELKRSREFFDGIESRPLTDEQRLAVTVDERRNLVVAAAGSGKTSVITAKAAWLVSKGYRKSSELLLLAFARDARQEMEERIAARLPEAGSVTVRTFHSLGTAIIGAAEGKRPALAASAESDGALFKLIGDIVDEMLADPVHAEAFDDWFQEGFAPYQSEREFRNWGEYHDYIRKFDIRSLKGETVRSFEECEIANFLYLHGVAYKYEAPYERDLATAQRRRYQPDFRLPEHGIYIEHFGIDRAGNTAPFIDRRRYHEEMEWKRGVHARYGTALIETFSWEQAEGRLLRNLTEKLEAHGVTLSQIPPDAMVSTLKGQGRLNPFVRLAVAFLQHFKGSRLSASEIAGRARAAGVERRAELFFALFWPIFERYQAALAAAGEIDFHDMIARAADLTETGRYRSPFGYILVDEFQDISPSRARLLKALLDSAPGSQLFAVGDDWQAIYRFGGADIAVMRDFGQHFGDCRRLDLTTTFRCADRIAALAADFVLRNPRQIRKEVNAVRRADGPAVFVGLSGGQKLPLLKDALDRVAEHAGRFEGPAEVLLLGRYRHLRPRELKSLPKRYPGLRFAWMTAHRSKGLEADYAVILGLNAGKHGFPAEIADDPLLDLVLAAPEACPNAEERRLLYVALTRARRQVYLLADDGPPSDFVTELAEEGYDVERFGRPPDRSAGCPRCVTGRLERRENARSGGVFYGCSNFPLCVQTARACPRCGHGLPVRESENWRCRDCGEDVESCPECDGWLDVRMGRFGRFLGCSNYPECGHTQDLRRPAGRKAAPAQNCSPSP